MGRATSLLEVDEDILDSALATLVEQRRVVVEERQGDRAVYLTLLHVAEVNVARRLITLVESPRQLIQIDVERAIQWVQRAIGIKLVDMQKETTRKAITSKVLVLTGGPGTGKITLVNCLIRILERKG